MGQVESLRTENKFKKTEIGEIPVDWEVKALKEVLSLNYGDGLPEGKRKGDKYPVFGSNGIIGYHDSFLVKGPGIIIGRKGTVGSITWSTEDYWPIDTTYYVVPCIGEIDLKWLYYILKILKLYQLNAATGTPGLNRNVALNIKIPLPPLSEQKKVAEILVSVDEAIDKKQEIIEKTNKLKKGLMQELLTRGIGHTKFKKTEIGEIPVDWEVKKIKDTGKIITGNTPPTKNLEYYNNDYLWATPGDLGTIKYIEFTARMLSRKGIEVSRLIPRDSILVVCIGSTIGKVGMALHDMATNQQINSIICNKSWNPHFVYYWMLENSDYLVSMAGKHAVPIINKTLFSLFSIPNPSKDEQSTIGLILNSLDEEIEKEIRLKENLEIIKKGLMHVLLTGKIRAKI